MIGSSELLMVVVLAAVLVGIGGRNELELFLVRFLAWLVSRPVDGQKLPKE